MRRIHATVASLVLVLMAGTSAAGADLPLMEVQLVTQGAAIHGANGLAVDASGRLLVASVWGREVAVLDPATGAIVEHIGPMIGDVDGGSPDDVAVAPDGSICWTDIMGGWVNCLRPDGTLDRQLVAQGVNPIAFTDDGRLFVGLAFFGDTLYELDPMLVQAPRVAMAGSGVAPWPDQLNGFDFGPDGLLYAPQPFHPQSGGRIVRIDVDATTPSPESVVDGVVATSVEWDPAATELYASLAVTGEVARVDVNTGTVTPFASMGTVLDNLTFAPDGTLFVSGSDDGLVARVSTADGSITTLSAGGMILPGGIAAMTAADGSEHLCVADLWSLVELDPATGAILSVDRENRAGGGITQPWTVAVDGSGLLLTSWMSNLVQRWDHVGDVELDAWPDFAAPVNALRFGDALVVAQLGTGSVVSQAPDGTRTTLAEGIAVPSGLAATADDLYVTDWAAGTVLQLVKDGLPAIETMATGLVLPEGLTVDADGSLLVVESGLGRVSRILPDGTTRLLAEGLPTGAPAAPNTPPAWAYSGVTVGADGTIYVTSDRLGGVWRLVERTAA